MDDHGDRLRLVGLSLFALVLRLVHGFSAVAPGNDGAHYLAQAKEFVSGDWVTALSCVFHPGKAMSFALLVRFLDPFSAAVVEGAVTGAVFVGLAYVIARQVAAPIPSLAVGALLAVSFHGVRLVGDVASETVYLPLAAVAVLASVRRKTMLAGCAIGAAYWVRPEALALMPMLFLGTRRTREKSESLIPVVSAVAGLAVVRWLWTGELAAMPKAAFMYHMGPLAAGGVGEALAQLGSNLVHLPLLAIAGLDYALVPVAVLGFVLLRRTRPDLARVVLTSLVIGWAAMVVFQVKERFFLSQLPLFVVFAAAGLELSTARVRKAALALVAIAAVVALARVTVMDLLVDPPRRDKEIELAVGRRLKGTSLVTDMPRVAFAAGRHPPPPRVWTAEALRTRIETERPFAVVIGKKRAGRKELLEWLRRRGYLEASALCEELRWMPGADRIAVYVEGPRPIR